MDALATLKVELPKPPNFLRLKDIMENCNLPTTIGVGHLTEENAVEIGEAMKQAFIEHAAKRRGRKG